MLSAKKGPYALQFSGDLKVTRTGRGESPCNSDMPKRGHGTKKAPVIGTEPASLDKARSPYTTFTAIRRHACDAGNSSLVRGRLLGDREVDVLAGDL